LLSCSSRDMISGALASLTSRMCPLCELRSEGGGGPLSSDSSVPSGGVSGILSSLSRASGTPFPVPFCDPNPSLDASPSADFCEDERLGEEDDRGEFESRALCGLCSLSRVCGGTYWWNGVLPRSEAWSEA
jgi:hypothetical protein